MLKTPQVDTAVVVTSGDSGKNNLSQPDFLPEALICKVPLTLTLILQ